MPYATVRRTRWDLAAQAEAVNLDMLEPGWVIVYSLGRRSYFAIAAGSVDEQVIVEAASIDQLRERMREAECSAADHRHSHVHALSEVRK